MRFLYIAVALLIAMGTRTSVFASADFNDVPSLLNALDQNSELDKLLSQYSQYMESYAPSYSIKIHVDKYFENQVALSGLAASNFPDLYVESLKSLLDMRSTNWNIGVFTPEEKHDRIIHLFEYCRLRKRLVQFESTLTHIGKISSYIK